MHARLALVVLAGSLLLAGAACGGDDDDAGDARSLEGTAWTLTSGVDFPEGEAPTLTLEDGNASGFGGCNQFSGGYEVDGDSISLGPLASTMMACEETKMATESAYLPALEAADSWAIESGELVLSKGGEESLRFSAG